MRCPHCGTDEDRVVDSRPNRDGSGIRRRRACTGCDGRFTTWERVELPELLVAKRDGSTQPFAVERVLRGMTRAAAGRDVPADVLSAAANEVERGLRALDERVVASRDVGAQVMRRLRELDEVAFVRFASVYEDFQGAADFEEVLSTLRTRGDAASARRALDDPERDLDSSGALPRR